LESISFVVWLFILVVCNIVLVSIGNLFLKLSTLRKHHGLHSLLPSTSALFDTDEQPDLAVAERVLEPLGKRGVAEGQVRKVLRAGQQQLTEEEEVLGKVSGGEGTRF
jgi:hypothetical protein